MSKLANSSTKIGRFFDRNEGAPIRGLIRELAAHAYRRAPIRAFVRAIAPRREPEKWLFIVGCYNSGTTILRRLLEGHPEIAAFPYEGVDLTDAFPDLERGGWRRMMFHHRDEWHIQPQDQAWRARRARKDWAIWWPKSVSVFLEKSIDHTVRMEWTDAQFKNAYFIGITRNGLCVNEGILRRSTPLDRAREEVGDTYPPDVLGRQWAAFADILASGDRKVERFHSVRYEDLMAAPVSTLDEIFKFLEMEPPTLELVGNEIHVGETRHELIDQNAASLTRLPDTSRASMLPHMQKQMRHFGYFD